MHRRLRRPPHRPSATWHPPAHAQSRWLAARARRRGIVQAAQLDVAASTTLQVDEPDDDQRAAGVVEVWNVTQAKTSDRLIVSIHEVLSDTTHELGTDPGLIKDGVEAHLQELLAAQIELLGEGSQLIRREYFTAIGPVDIMARDANGEHVAVELKRRGDIDGVEQLTRYLELLNRDPLLAPVHGVFAAQEIKPQARTLAEDRGIRCLVLDYDAMRGTDDADERLF